MPETLHFAPNVPVTLALVDPEGTWDAELRQGQYQTTTGQSFSLPRVAVVALNLLEPKPGEEIQITRFWKGRPSDPIEWAICLSPRSEEARVSRIRHNEAYKPAVASMEGKPPVATSHPNETILEPPKLIFGQISPPVKSLPVKRTRGRIPSAYHFPYPSGGIFRRTLCRTDAVRLLITPDLASVTCLECRDILNGANRRAGQIGLWERGE